MATILKAYNALLEPTIRLSTTSWILGTATATTISVTIGPTDTPYEGVVNLSYGSGITGPATATVSNGNALIQVTRNSTASTTLAVTIPKKGNILEKTETFTGTMSGQEVYITGPNATVYTVVTSRDEGENGDAGGCSAIETTYRLTVNGQQIYSSGRAPTFPLWVNGVGYNRGEQKDSDYWKSNTPITCYGWRRTTYYSVIFV